MNRPSATTPLAYLNGRIHPAGWSTRIRSSLNAPLSYAETLKSRCSWSPKARRCESYDEEKRRGNSTGCLEEESKRRARSKPSDEKYGGKKRRKRESGG